MLTYNLVMSIFLLIWYHGKVVVPGNERGILVGIMAFLGKVVVRGWILVFVLFFGFAAWGWVGPGYEDWFYSYSADHSMLLWGVTTPPVTAILWYLWTATFTCAKSPGSIGWWAQGKAPNLHRVSMGLPAIWGAVFYSWLLFSPSLPFYSCFVRHLLLRIPLEVALR